MRLKGSDAMMSGQRGVVLIVVLVILLAVTLLGTVVMQNATVQMKMVSNTQAHQQAFNSAEAILAEAENFLATTSSITLVKLSNGSVFKADCTGGPAGGLCFSGAYAPGPTGQQNCSLGAIPTQEVWENGNALDVWGTNGRHANVTPQNMTKAGMYVIEFRCFIDGASKVVGQTGDALFRITARATSENGNAVVMLQSTYRTATPQ